MYGLAELELVYSYYQRKASHAALRCASSPRLNEAFKALATDVAKAKALEDKSIKVGKSAATRNLWL